MVFTSHIFVFYFLPLVLLFYYAVPVRRNLQLLFASYVFYGWQEPWFVFLMLAMTLVNYVCGRVIAASRDRPGRAKWAVAGSVAGSLGLLGYFKYAMFTQRNVNALLSAIGAGTFEIHEVILPIGISFYTFQSLSYTIDLYRGTSPPVRSFWDFACFVSLFPQLIAGPIVRYNTIADQLVTRSHRVDKFASGVALFILGFGKKLMLADPMGQVADATFAAESPPMLDAWFGVLAYAMQIYFDFAGYSDMAIGLGRMIGFEFPRNFNAPYRADSITDFWRRWHISLSTFLRDYLYIPLGGNRKGRRRTYVNLMIVMLLGGLWHGANWTYVCWGAIHGVMLAFERMIGKQGVYARLPRPLRVSITFVIVLISWVFFRAETLSDAATYLSAMFGMGGTAGGSVLLGSLIYTRKHLIEIAACALFVLGPVQAFDWVNRLSGWKVIVLIGLFVLAILTMFVESFSPFLYFQF